MEMLYLLLVLTRNGAGDVSAAFVNSESLEACRVSQAMVEGIFVSQGIPLISSECRLSPLRFTPFEHVDTTRARRYHYLIDPQASTPQIRPVPDWKRCREGESQRPGERRIYCASSTQRLLSEP